AASHRRVFIVEIMGNKVGWVTLHAGIAGGADIILLPEIPYDIEVIAQAIQNRTNAGKYFTILAVAEGAITKEDYALTKKEYKAKLLQRNTPSIAYELAEQIQEKTGQEIRITVPGHTQRGGSPCPYDRVLATRLGAKAAELIMQEEFGYMVGIVNNQIVKIPLEEVAGKLKRVNPEAEIIKEAEMIGISFGNK
ncbi:MAG: 6-phosphofructokinase, partial [Lachnospiraceae bacterium]